MGSRNQARQTIFWCSKNAESAEINSKALSGYEKLFIPDIKPSLNVQSESILPFKTFYTIMMYTNAIIIQTSTRLKTSHFFTANNDVRNIKTSSNVLKFNFYIFHLKN